ncbi:UNVERIFIED_CONTAM: hypothetical protein FKN15_004048 [Acipenser sinensis]
MSAGGSEPGGGSSFRTSLASQFFTEEETTAIDMTTSEKEIIAFQTDKSMEVRKFVIGFIEEACKRDNELLLKLIANLNMLLKDESVNVVKKVILTMTHLYKVALQWMVRLKGISDIQEACWEMVTTMKDEIILMLDSENDGIRTHAIKFVESLIITLSPRTSDSKVPKRQENDISLERIPKDHAYIRHSSLGQEGKMALEQLLKFMVHPKRSSETQDQD